MIVLSQRNCRRARCMALALLAVTLGCTKHKEERSAVVTGKVTLGGAPLGAGEVLFMTEDGHAASEKLAADGSYTVKCRPDRYKVAVTPPAPPDPLGSPAGAAPPQPDTRPIPKKYQDLGSSGLSVDVKAGANNFDIALAP
jgi:hypothetical protein